MLIFLASRYDVASSWAEKAMPRQSDFPISLYAYPQLAMRLAGRLSPAQADMARALECDPDFARLNLEDLSTISSSGRPRHVRHGSPQKQAFRGDCGLLTPGLERKRKKRVATAWGGSFAHLVHIQLPSTRNQS